MSPWWKDKWGSDKICPITLKRLRPGKNKYGFKYVVKLSCNHSFYRKAILHWYCNQMDNELEPSCPLCRKKMLLKDFE